MIEKTHKMHYIQGYSSSNINQFIQTNSRISKKLNKHYKYIKYKFYEQEHIAIKLETLIK